MIIDASLPSVPLSSVPAIARTAEEMGFHTLWSSETIHDPFLPGTLITEHTSHLHFGTAVAVSFARSPATIAYTAWDLAHYSSGRFILGLGTQVKAHIERRFGMPWPESVTGKLSEQIAAVRAFWSCWQNGTPLSYRGEYYRLNLMSPFFNPGPIDHPDIPIHIAGVNAGLAQLAGRSADGFLVHPLHSSSYLQEIILPALEQGATKAGRNRSEISVSVTAFAVTTPEENALVRAQIAFYASTPSYRAVMSHHGWEETAIKLSALARRGQWSDMLSLISDEMLATFSVIAQPEALSEVLCKKYQGLADHLTLYIPFMPGERDQFWRQLITHVG